MATAEQIKSLVRSHFSQEPERFYTMALQVAAYEAKQGHSSLAHELREIVETERKKAGPRVINFPQDLRGLVFTEEPKTKFSSMVMSAELEKRLKLIIDEYVQQEKLKSFGLSNRRKALLVGPPGTGKTMTFKVLAYELRLPLHTIQVDRLVTKFMGETSAKLRQIFELMEREKGVYLFDEFDAIGGERSLDNDVGEMRRVLNTFLQFIEQDTSDSFIVAATNNPGLLDHALFRRFDDVIQYENPSADLRKSLIANSLGMFTEKGLDWDSLTSKSDGLSHAEIYQACCDAIKIMILSDAKKVSAKVLLTCLADRKSALSYLQKV